MTIPCWHRAYTVRQTAQPLCVAIPRMTVMARLFLIHKIPDTLGQFAARKGFAHERKGDTQPVVALDGILGKARHQKDRTVGTAGLDNLGKLNAILTVRLHHIG